MRKNSLELFKYVINQYKKNKDLTLAKKIQNHYSKIVLKNLKKWDNINWNLENLIIGGIDISFLKDQSVGIAGIVILNKNLEILEKQFLIKEIHFPYISGFLSFRELDIILDLFHIIKTIPDILCFDGQGIAHPRFLGIATHGGLILDIPSIGIGKTKLVGEYIEPAKTKGSKSPLYYKNIQVGWVIRSRSFSKPIFVSPGWKVGLSTIPEIIIPMCNYKIPEPTRLAHILVSEIQSRIKHKLE